MSQKRLCNRGIGCSHSNETDISLKYSGTGCEVVINHVLPVQPALFGGKKAEENCFIDCFRKEILEISIFVILMLYLK